MTVQNIYGNQLAGIAKMIDALDVIAATIEGDVHDLSLGSKIEIMDAEGVCLLGHLVDEVGGAWSFRAAVSGATSSGS